MCHEVGTLESGQLWRAARGAGGAGVKVLALNDGGAGTDCDGGGAGAQLLVCNGC